MIKQFEARELEAVRRLAIDVVSAQARLRGALEMYAAVAGISGEITLLDDWSGIEWLPEKQQHSETP